MKGLFVCSLTLSVLRIAISAAALEARDPGTEPPQLENPQVKAEPRTEEDATKLSWDSPRLRAIERRLESLDLSQLPREDRQQRRFRSFEEIVEKEFSKQELHALAASCATMAIEEKDRSQFANDLIEQLLSAFLHSGDREGLVIMLSTRCPRLLGFSKEIEFSLVYYGEPWKDVWKGLKDPILILGEAYAKSEVAQVQREIAAAVRRAFTDLGVRGKDDAEFVKNAMQFYEQHEDELILNLGYCSGRSKENPLFERSAKRGHH